MTKFRLVLIVILGGALVALGYRMYQDHRDLVSQRDQAIKNTGMLIRAMAQRNAQSTQPFFDSAIYRAIPRIYPRPASRWVTNEKLFYQKILAASHYDVLVAPLQVDGSAAFDRPSRSLMGAELAAAVSRTQPGSVCDPFLMEKVLGDGQRQYLEEDLYRIANLVGAKRIIWGATGLNSAGAMTITVLSQSRPAAATSEGKWPTPIARSSVASVALDAEHPPIDAFEQRIPEILKAIDLDPAALAKPRTQQALDLTELPNSPLGLMTSADNPARDAYNFLLLGALTPANVERTKERFVEKAFLALSRLSPTAPDYRALSARAYVMLGYRAAAMHALGTPSSAEEREIGAMLIGNLAEVRTEAAREPNPLKRLLAQLDASHIGTDYEVETSSQSLDMVKALHLPGQVWPFLAARAFTDWDVWSDFNNASLKRLIDHELPVAGYSFDELMRGAMSVGDTGKIDSLLALSVFNHTQKYLEAHATHCCDLPIIRSNALDYMELLSAMGHDNLIRHMNHLANTQGLNREAIQFADSIQAVYEGYPYFEVVRGEAEIREASSMDGAERDGLTKSAYERVFNAMYWEQGQSSISSRALNDLGEYFRLHEYGFFNNFYYTDLPYHPLYNTWASGDPALKQANGLAALANATSQFQPALGLIGEDQAKYADKRLVEEVIKQIQGRFIGNPVRGRVLAQQEILHGNAAAAKVLLRENIRTIPAYKDSYDVLGRLELETGNPDAASKVFLSFPGLRNGSTVNHVEIANTAFAMGQYFYGSGDFEHATEFMKIAASQDTGANLEMFAAQNLALLAGDINAAKIKALERAQRYHDSKAYRDYFGILHATKHSAEAWAGFSAVVQGIQEPYLWETALVGHHMAGDTESEVAKWAEQDEFKGAGNHVSYAMNYLARFATTDRIPSKDLARAIADHDRPVWQFETGALSVVRPDADGRDQQILGPAGAITAEGVLHIGEFDHGGPKHRVRSSTSYFVSAYRSLKLRDYPMAKRELDEASGLYDMGAAPSSYMLPYYALASVGAGTDVTKVEGILKRTEPAEQRFDYQLARAVLSAGKKNIGEALESLKLARYRRPGTDERVALTQYTYGDICEELYHITGSEEIRKLLLNWVRSKEKAEPWHSWSFAMEAVLTSDPDERSRALAMTHYLDPKSAHLAQFKQSEIDDAVKAFSSSNIFKRPGPRKAGETAT